MGTIGTFLNALKAHIEACTPEAWTLAFPDYDCPCATALEGISVELVPEEGDVEGGVDAVITKLDGRAIFIDWTGAEFDKFDALTLWSADLSGVVSLWSSALLLPADAPGSKDVAETLWMWCQGTRLTLPDVPGNFNDLRAAKLEKVSVEGAGAGTIYVVYGFNVAAQRTLATDRN